MIAPSRRKPPATIGWASFTSGRFHRGKQAPERKQDRAVPAWRDRAGARAAMPGQALASSCSSASQRLISSMASDTSSCVRPWLCRSTKAADACPKAQAWTCIDRRSTRRSSSSWTARAIAAAASRRANFGAPVLALELARIAKRRCQPQDLGRVKRLAHSRRQVVPFGPSSKTMPSALSSSRMRSAVAKSRFFLAAARSAMRVIDRRCASRACPGNQSASAECLKQAEQICALALSAPPSSAESRDSASGVFRSSRAPRERLRQPRRGFGFASRAIEPVEVAFACAMRLPSTAAAAGNARCSSASRSVSP